LEVEAVVVRLIAGKAEAVLEIPPLVVEQPAVLSLRLSRLANGEPIKGAQVSMGIAYLDHAAVPVAGKAHHSAPGSVQLVSESSGGAYQSRHTFAKPGHYEVTAKVQLEDEEEGEQLEISARQEVVSQVAPPEHARKIGTGALSVAAMILMMGLMMGGSWLF
jgi:hypothetical protein